jgi:hypothetical protein
MIDRELETLKKVAQDFSHELRSGARMRKNPVGGDSYVERLGTERARIVKSLPGYPKANPAAPASYGAQFPFSVKYRKSTTISKGERAGQRMPVTTNGGLVMAWGGPVSEREEQAGYGPKLPNGKSWAGVGWKIMNDLANVEPAFTGEKGHYYPFQTLTPYGRANPEGTGIWNVIISRMRANAIRTDEAWVGGRMVDAIGQVLAALAMNSYKGSVREAKSEIANYFDVLATVLFGTTSTWEMDKIQAEGVQNIQQYAEQKAAEREGGGRPAPSLSGLAALGRGVR